MGHPVIDEQLFTQDLSDAELRDVVSELLSHLNLDVWKTNRTKHGYTIIELRSNT